MATKAELEAEVEQLKAQLASGQPPDVAAMTAELDKLKADLDALSDEKAQLLDQLQKVTDSALQGNAVLEDALKASAAQKADLDELKKVTDQDAQEIVQLHQQLDALKQDLQVAQDALKDEPLTPEERFDGHHVVLDGAKHDIIWRSTVKDLAVEGYHKRHVDEDMTAVVIRKPGG